VNDQFGEGIHQVLCILGPKKSETASIRFDAKKFSVAQAKKWLKEHDKKPTLFEPAAKSASLGSLLYMPNSATGRAVRAAQSNVYLKELIHVGKFRRPDTGDVYDIKEKQLESWAETFARMRGNGLKIPIPLTHKEADNPDHNRGWVREMFVDTNRLMGILELNDEDPDRLAANSDVSIFCPQEFIDSQGNVYEQPITHIALVTDPLIPGLKGFVPVAASQGQVNIPIYTFEKEKNMDMKELQKVLGSEEEPTEETLPGLIAASLKGLQDKNGELEKKLKAAKKEDKKEDKTVVAFAPEPDPELIRLSRENRLMKLGTLVANSRITPAVEKKLRLAFIGEDDTALKAALKQGDGQFFDTIMAALEDNDPVKLREQTGPQIMTLSKQGEGKRLDPDLEKRVSAAYGK